MLFNNFDDNWGSGCIFLGQHGQHVDKWFAVDRQICKGRGVLLSNDILLRISFVRHYDDLFSQRCRIPRDEILPHLVS